MLAGRTALIVIGFPDRSLGDPLVRITGLQEILPLRTENSRGFALLADGVPDGYTAAAGLRDWLGG